MCPHVPYVVQKKAKRPYAPYVVQYQAKRPTLSSSILYQLPTSHNPAYAPTYTDHPPTSHTPDRNRNNTSRPFVLYKYW